MSVVATKIYKDKIIISADSIEIDEVERTQRKFRDAKLFQLKNMVIGGAGNCAEMDLFIEFCKKNKPKRASKEGLTYFMADFHRWFDMMINSKNEATELYNAYIMVYKNKVFEIDTQYVREVKDFSAVGAGKDYALTALYLNHTPQKAVEVACELSVWCEKPINTIEIKL